MGAGAAQESMARPWGALDLVEQLTKQIAVREMKTALARICQQVIAHRVWMWAKHAEDARLWANRRAGQVRLPPMSPMAPVPHGPWHYLPTSA